MNRKMRYLMLENIHVFSFHLGIFIGDKLLGPMATLGLNFEQLPDCFLKHVLLRITNLCARTLEFVHEC